MIKAVIFDLDGTLLNTAPEINYIINQALIHYNIPQITFKQTLKYIGNGAKKLVERAVPPEFCHLKDAVYNYFIKSYAISSNLNTSLYDGSHEVLTKLKSRGIKLAIITNKPQAATEQVYKQFLSQYAFDVVIGQSDKYVEKPNPQSTLDAITGLGVKKEECIFVGDGETDVQTAINAGITGVAALWGYRSKEQLTEAGAVNFVNNFVELDQFIFNKKN